MKDPRGGPNRNQGRKPKYSEPTVTLSFRCPESKVQEIRNVITTKLLTYAKKLKDV